VKIVLTRHAEVRIKERSLAVQWIERIARDPEWMEPDPTAGTLRLFGRVPEAGNCLLRVGVVNRADVRYVLSALPTAPRARDPEIRVTYDPSAAASLPPDQACRRSATT
jgi:hypothetical protein